MKTTHLKIIIAILFILLASTLSVLYKEAKTTPPIKKELVTTVLKSEETTQPVAQTIAATKTEKTVVEIVKEWSPQVVFISCVWSSSRGEPVVGLSGSGFLTNFNDGEMAIITNKHVILYEDVYSPTYCNVGFLNADTYDITDQNSFRFSADYDIGRLTLPEIKQTTRDLIKRTDGFYCPDVAEIGEKIVVLGYPGNGSKEGITVTEGIISGYDHAYYVTSAKIDHGNSGGIAISLKNNCIVGIPSASVGGKLESLGRILSSKAVLE